MSENKLNLTMLCDFYELTMGNGYFEKGYKDRICYFDVFYRTIPDQAGYAIFAGLEQIVDYIKEWRFDAEDIAYLRSKNLIEPEEVISLDKELKDTKEYITLDSIVSTSYPVYEAEYETEHLGKCVYKQYNLLRE